MQILKNETYYTLQNNRSYLNNLLLSILCELHNLSTMLKVTFIPGEIGSGSCTYKFNDGSILSFNQFTWEFNGFYINDKLVDIICVCKLMSQ